MIKRDLRFRASRCRVDGIRVDRFGIGASGMP